MLLLALPLSVALGAACGDGGSDKVRLPTVQLTVETTGEDATAVERAVRAAIDAWNAGDVDRFLAAFTDRGIRFEFDATRAEAKQLLAERIGELPRSADEIVVVILGDTATATATYFFGQVGGYEALSLVRKEGRWLFEGSTFLTADLAPGVTPVELELADYAFRFDPAQMRAGNVMFTATNAGAEDHEVVLARIPAGLDLAQAVAAPELPSDVQVLGVVGPIPPGDVTTIRTKEALALGRYALFCLLENAQGTPHAELGMYADFTVERSATRGEEGPAIP